jgi:hypothetical protein
MSRDELKTLIDRSSIEDRIFLSAYLKHIAAKDDPSVQRALGDAHREIERGKKVRLSQLKSLHRTLAKSGL